MDKYCDATMLPAKPFLFPTDIETLVPKHLQAVNVSCSVHGLDETEDVVLVGDLNEFWIMKFVVGKSI